MFFPAPSGGRTLFGETRCVGVSCCAAAALNLVILMGGGGANFCSNYILVLQF